ncbi:MAG: hypothetical protein R6X20_03985, partial [Phycisphaerae bacterium]
MPERSPSSGPETFLADLDLRPLNLPNDHNLEPVGLALGQGQGALEVAVMRAPRRPTQVAMRTVWKARQGGRATPVLLVALYDEKAAICGERGDEPPVYLDLDRNMVERLCRTALAEPDRHAASRFLRAAIPEVESPLPGLRNEGLFAFHELDWDVPQRHDWAEAQDQAAPLLGLRGTELLEGLGYEVERTAGATCILRAGNTRMAVAVLLDRNESCDVASERFSGASPVSYALNKADQENLSYVVVSRGASLRIYPTATGVGTGGRGRTETFIEVHLDLLPTDKAGYLWLLFSGDALAREGSFGEILDQSHRYAADLGVRLRERIYDDVVPPLAMAIVRARDLQDPTTQDLDDTYEMALTVLFRLLFIAYAEDNDLLPYRTNDRYKSRSLKQKATELADMKRSGGAFATGATLWREIADLCKAVNEGQPEWDVPPYDGGLFSEDPQHSLAGAELAAISLPNESFGPALTNLLVEETNEGIGPVDFRSLGVRDFGTIYEGLLESELSVAEVNLVVERRGLYFPAEEGEAPKVRAGEVYLHNAAGARKATGSYYTKDFAVEHLLNHALEPALAEHLARLDDLDDRRAAEAFFDFRVADIAMGSGHFLIAAVDHIERGLAGYLARRRLPEVVDELQRLRRAAHDTLGDLAEGLEIEDHQLLRRQIARRCVYGVDLNRIAVHLARLSLWIHTFVPGLPLSFLDHNIVCGNSLVGIATFDEVAERLNLDGDAGLFDNTAEALVGSAEDALLRLARLSDANAAEIERAREAFHEQKEALTGTARRFDILSASRLPDSGIGLNPEELQNDLFVQGIHRRATEVLAEIPPFHFPIAFPEVFLRDRAGFDVVVGNPPWEEAMLEKDDFWARYRPGLQSLPQTEQERIKRRLRRERPDLVNQYERELGRAELLRKVLVTGPFPGMGSGDPDLYKAFCWRFWHLVSDRGGRIGVVLPRSAWCAKGSTAFREMAFEGGVADITLLLNNANWVFPEVHPQYTITLTALHKAPAEEERTVSLLGPFRSRQRYETGKDKPPARFPCCDALEWTDTGALPLLPAEGAVEVFAQLRRAPRLDRNVEGEWRARPYTELHATNDKDLMCLRDNCPEGYWPVYKGESFDIWQPDTGTYYAWAEPEAMKEHLQVKRQRSRNRRRSPFSEFLDAAWFNDPGTLPCLHPRIAFRDVSRSTDSRTLRAALVPPKVFITNKGPYFLWPRGDEKDQAFLLGVLSSIPLDWYARRFVETTVNYHILNPFPVPRPGRDDALWRRTVELAGRLACPDDRFGEWAEAVGVEWGPLEANEKDNMIFELDAVVAHLYGLSEDHV